jgi:hypothetical protein
MIRYSIMSNCGCNKSLAQRVKREGNYYYFRGLERDGKVARLAVKLEPVDSQKGAGAVKCPAARKPRS